MYRAAGVLPPARELPDHLPVLLEFAATVDEDAGRPAPQAPHADRHAARGPHRVPVAVCGIVAAVSATLPPATDQEVLGAHRLAMQGPPAESVGLEPFALTVPPRRIEGRRHETLGALFWDIVPYVTIAILVVGTWWRYRYDKFGWTTRSSQLYESRLLRIGSPLFHFGILVVIFGHVIGLVIPQSWTSAIG